MVKQTCDRRTWRAIIRLSRSRDPRPWHGCFPDSTMSLFAPDDPWNTTRLFRFLHEVNAKHRLRLASYLDLYQWSVSDNARFWSHVWDHTRIIGNKGRHVVDATATPAENPAWFSDSTVNFSENLLSNRSPDTTAIVQVCT